LNLFHVSMLSMDRLAVNDPQREPLLGGPLLRGVVAAAGEASRV
jgi:hypothetical protein